MKATKATLCVDYPLKSAAWGRWFVPNCKLAWLYGTRVNYMTFHPISIKLDSKKWLHNHSKLNLFLYPWRREENMTNPTALLSCLCLFQSVWLTLTNAGTLACAQGAIWDWHSQWHVHELSLTRGEKHSTTLIEAGCCLKRTVPHISQPPGW